MALAAGTRFGPYEIVAAIGTGGMGEVYQAHDTKLARDVAIKVLPEAFAHDPERLSRFQREAKMLAALNHPAIATIYGLEQFNGTSYLVMELVSGETLQQRLAREGPLPIEDALGVCRQIAEALEAAQEKGIIHRDLKPANVKVTPEGKVKVLDFGLAKAFAGAESGSDPSNSPTLTVAGTIQGVILGTAAYMSPEQARGKAVDRATDIWAFGCMLYELLCGRPAFEGEDVTEILAAVVKTDPDWNRLPQATPAAARRLLRRCLRKDRRQRFQDATDTRIEIEDALAAPSVDPTAAGLAKRDWKQVVAWDLAVLVAAVVAGLAGWNLKPAAPPVPRPVIRFTITLPPGQQLAGLDNGPALALSPDGTHLAYVARQGGAQQLYLRAMDSLEARPVPGTEGAVDPFFSPDGQWLGFFAAGKLKKISVSRGSAFTLADASPPRGASWDSQGLIAFAPSSTGVQQVSDAGGAPQPLTRLDREDVGHHWPEFLPDGKAVLFAAYVGGSSQVAVQSVGKGDRRNLIPGGTQPRYARSGHLVYAQDGNLLAVPFDPQRLTVTGATVPVVEGVAQASPPVDAAQYSVSATGSLVYVPGGVQTGQLVWISRDGVEQPLAAPARAYQSPRISPDGQRFAVDAEGQIWLDDLSRPTLSRFTLEGNLNIRPVWTSNGKHVAFTSNKDISWQVSDGSGGVERLFTSSGNPILPTSFSPDEKMLAFVEFNASAKGGYQVSVLRLSDRTARTFSRTHANEGSPRFSPDGHWLAYISDESGRNEVYVQPYPGPGPGRKLQISTDGGTEPAWNPKGRELFYRSGDKIMAVAADMTDQRSFAPGNPRMLFQGAYVPATGPVTNYDVSPDGQRFLMIKPSKPALAAPTEINVVLNWTEELKQRVQAASQK